MDIETQAGALADRIFNSAIGFGEIATIHVGDRLGLYRSLRDDGPATAQDLAARTGIHSRYAREWLEQQASAGLIEVDDVTAAPDFRKFSLSAAHAMVLSDPDSAYSMAPVARMLAASVIAFPKLLDAYRDGSGIPWEDFGVDMIESQGDFNRPWLRSSLASEYLPSVPDIHQSLQSGARVLDVACGVGWAALAIAEAYPNTSVEGIDLDEGSIRRARNLAAEQGLVDRVKFDVLDAAEAEPGSFDLALIVEAVHDLTKPVEVLAAVKRALKPGASLLIADENVAEEFQAPGGEVEQFMYAVSTMVCLPAVMGEPGSAEIGTVIRPGVIRALAAEAGFESVEILDIDHPFLRFYRCT